MAPQPRPEDRRPRLTAGGDALAKPSLDTRLAPLLGMSDVPEPCLPPVPHPHIMCVSWHQEKQRGQKVILFLLGVLYG